MLRFAQFIKRNLWITDGILIHRKVSLLGGLGMWQQCTILQARRARLIVKSTGINMQKPNLMARRPDWTRLEARPRGSTDHDRVAYLITWLIHARGSDKSKQRAIKELEKLRSKQ
jgi:hypothetical protein